MFVVVWEPRYGAGGGHQLVMDQRKASQISMDLGRKMPDADIRVLSAHDYGAAAVVERQRRQMRR